MFSKHSRLALSSSWLLAAASMVAMCGPAAAAEFEYDPGDNVQFTYCHSHPPVLRIKPGDRVVTSTRDASNDVYSTCDKTLFPKLELSIVNPQTGSLFIEFVVPGSHGANMDFNEVIEGVTMYFPVYERGALFMLGDEHAAQGDGEIDGAAIETSFNVRFTVNLIKGKRIAWPRLVNDKVIMSI